MYEFFFSDIICGHDALIVRIVSQWNKGENELAMKFAFLLEKIADELNNHKEIKQKFSQKVIDPYHSFNSMRGRKDIIKRIKNQTLSSWIRNGQRHTKQNTITANQILRRAQLINEDRELFKITFSAKERKITSPSPLKIEDIKKNTNKKTKELLNKAIIEFCLYEERHELNGSLNRHLHYEKNNSKSDNECSRMGSLFLLAAAAILKSSREAFEEEKKNKIQYYENSCAQKKLERENYDETRELNRPLKFDLLEMGQNVIDYTLGLLEHPQHPNNTADNIE